MITTNDAVFGQKTFQSSKYNIDQLSYPADLMDPIYGGHMVVFYINVNKASKFLKSNPETVDLSELDVPRDRGLLIAKELSNLAMAATGALGGALVGAMTGSKTALGISSVVGGATIYAAGSIGGTTTREQKRLKTAIALHMPNSLSIKYGVGWAEEDTAAAEMVGVLGEDGMAMLKSLGDTKTSTLSDEQSAFKSSAEKAGTDIQSMAASVGLANAPGGVNASVRTGLASNPRKELVFKGVDFRTFSFEYSFFPRTDIEAKNVESIIHNFKYHMHPEYMDTNSFLYLYPSEFDISYYTKEGENLHIHRHTSCVLTEMNINYTPNANFNVFSNGMPTQINIQLSFKELSSPTKDSIEKGI